MSLLIFFEDGKKKWGERKNRRTPEKWGYFGEAESKGQQNHEKNHVSTGGRTAGRERRHLPRAGRSEDGGSGDELSRRAEK